MITFESNEPSHADSFGGNRPASSPPFSSHSDLTRASTCSRSTLSLEDLNPIRVRVRVRVRVRPNL